MKSIERRLRQLEEILKRYEESKLQKKLTEFYTKYEVPTPSEFVEALAYRDKLESINSEWIKRILEKGGKGELMEILELTDELFKKNQNQM
jgi:hypothetical protein